MKSALFGLATILLLAASACTSSENSYRARNTNDLIDHPEDVSIVYVTTGLDKLPVIKRGKIPSHPDSQRWKRGYAQVRFWISEKGKTEDIRVTHSEGKYFGGNTAYAVRFWRFEPATKNGEPVACEAVYEIYFRGLHFGGVNE